jgi:hypothetical protein
MMRREAYAAQQRCRDTRAAKRERDISIARRLREQRLAIAAVKAPTYAEMTSYGSAS